MSSVASRADSNSASRQGVTHADVTPDDVAPADDARGGLAREGGSRPDRRRPLLVPVRGVIIAGLIGALAFACGVALTATSGWLIVRASQRPIVLTLLTAIVAVRTFGIGRPFFRYVERLVSHNAALADLTERRTAAYRQLLPLTPARLGTRRRADLLSGVVRDLDDEVDIQVRVIVPLITTVGAAAVALVATFLIHPPAGFVMLGFIVVAALVGWLDLALERHGQAASLKARGQVDRVAHLVSSGATELAAIGATDAPMAWLAHAQKNVEKAATAQARGRAAGVALTLLATGAATLLMAWTLDGEVRSGAIDGPFAALLLLTPLALGDVVGLIPDAVGSFARSAAARDRLQALLTQEPAVAARGTHGVADGAPTIELDDVTASWTGARTDTGPHTLTIAPGEHLAITGPNGCGKSTLLAVLARHLDPSGGTCRWDGVDVRDLDADAVRSRIAFVDDDPHLFAGTLGANLLLAQPGASEDEVRAALRRAGLGGWLDELTDGLDTHLGEYLVGAGRDGAATAGTATERSISGGERARLGIARALLSERPVIALDEPVAHLDGPTADAVIRDLLEASDGRTVVMVSHHPVAFDALDRVVELEFARA